MLSYSLATNVPGKPPKYFECRKGDDNDSITKLLNNFVNKLMQISDRSVSILSDEYKDRLGQLSAAIERETEYNERQNTFEQKDFPLQALQRDFNIWLRQLPIIGFNSSRYDLNLIQEYLIPILYASNKNIANQER